MTKIEVISQKPLKNWVFGKNDHFWTIFHQKTLILNFSTQVTALTHPRSHLGEDFRKFLAKANDKILRYLAKTFKKLDFCRK